MGWPVRQPRFSRDCDVGCRALGVPRFIRGGRACPARRRRKRRPPMTALFRLSSGLVLLALAGCAAAMPGYVPDKGRLQVAKDKAAAKSDQRPTNPIAADGTYTLTKTERDFNCRRLTGVLQIKIQQYRAETSRQPTSRITAATESAMAKPMAGGHVKPDNDREHAIDRARLVALNELMIEKKCGRFDLATALDPANTATPEPIKPEGKKDKKKK
jgi:hypothetical protein